MRRRYSDQKQNNSIRTLHRIATQQLRTSLRPHNHALPLMSIDCLSARTVLYVYHLSVASRALIPTSSSLWPRGMYVCIMTAIAAVEGIQCNQKPWPTSDTRIPLWQGNGTRKRSRQRTKLVFTRSVVHATVLLKSVMWWRQACYPLTFEKNVLNHLTPNGHFSGRTAPLT
jgi:hypothetical protein